MVLKTDSPGCDFRLQQVDRGMTNGCSRHKSGVKNAIPALLEPVTRWPVTEGVHSHLAPPDLHPASLNLHVTDDLALVLGTAAPEVTNY